MKGKAYKLIFVMMLLVSILVVSCGDNTSSSVNTSSITSSEEVTSSEESSEAPVFVVEFLGLEATNHIVKEVVNVLNGVTALGSDNKNYTSSIVVSSDNCEIIDNKITSETPKTCVVKYEVNVDEDEFFDTKEFIFKDKPLTSLTINGASDKSIFIDTTFNVLSGISVGGDDEKDYTDKLTYNVIEGASIDTTTHLLDTSIIGETKIKYEVVIGSINVSKIITISVKEKTLFNNDLSDPSGIVENGEKELLQDKVVDTFHIWRVLDLAWNCGPVVNVPYAMYDGQLDVDVVNLNNNTNNWSVQLFYLTQPVEEDGFYSMEFDIYSEKARKITIDRRTNFEDVTLNTKTASMLGMDENEQIVVSLTEGLNNIKVNFNAKQDEHIMLKLLLGLHETQEASQSLLTFKNFRVYQVDEVLLTSLTITGPINRTISPSDSGFNLLDGVRVIGNDSKDYSTHLVISSENGIISNGILDVSEEGEYKILYSVIIGEVSKSIEITIKVQPNASLVLDSTMDGIMGENWKFINPLDPDGNSYMVKFEPTIEEGELRVVTEVGLVANDGDRAGIIYQDISNIEPGATYKLSFSAKSSVTRNVILRFRNPSKENNFVLAQQAVNLTGEFKLFEYQFVATNIALGDIARLAIHMGEAWGRPEGEHIITLDDVYLTKVKDAAFADPDNIFADGFADGHTFVSQPYFEDGRTLNWSYYLNDSSLVTERTFVDNKLVITMNNFSTATDWYYIIFYKTEQIQDPGIYVVTFMVDSTSMRRIVFDNSNAGCASPVTGRTDVALLEGEHTYTIEYRVDNSGQAIMLKILLGAKDDAASAVENYNGTLIFSNISITKKS